MNLNDKQKRILIISGVIGIIALIVLFAFLQIDIAGLMIDITQDYYDSFGELGVYFAIFIISVIGNFTVIIPVPYVLALVSAILVLPVMPVLIGIFSGLGAAIGELSSWLIGRGASEVAQIEHKTSKLAKNIKGLKELIKKGYGFWLTFIFAATPLPDDILLMALGLAKYPLKKALLAGILGKICMALSLSGLIIIAKVWPIGQWFLSLYGLQIVGNTAVSTENPLVSNITTIATIAVIVLIATTDWEAFFKRFKKKA